MSINLTRDVSMNGFKFTLPLVPKRFITIETPGHAAFLGEKILNSTVKFVAFDTETTNPEENKLWNGLHRCAPAFGASFSVGDGPVPDFTFWYRFGEANADLDEYMLSVIGHLFSDQGTYQVLMHHAAFDINRIRHTFGIEWSNPRVNDTLLMAQIMNKFPSNALKSLGRTLLQKSANWELLRDQWFSRMKVKVADRDFKTVPDAIMGPYAMTDTELTYEIFFKLKEHLSFERPELVELYKLERTLMPIVAELEWHGMLIDEAYFTDQLQKIAAQSRIWLDKFEIMWGKVNLRSPKQLVAILYGTDASKGQLGLPVKVRSIKTKQPSTKADVLEEYIDDHPLVEDLVSYQRLSRAAVTVQKLLAQSVLHPVGRAIHTSYTQVLISGRLSSSPNLQNFINDDRNKYRNILFGKEDVSTRRGFIAPKDCAYIKLDYAAFELRLIANASGDQQLQKMILDGVDCHSWLATKLYVNELTALNHDGELEKQFTVDSPLNQRWNLDWKYWAVNSKATIELKQFRNVVKICSFSIVYGASPEKISKTFKVDVVEAAKLRGIWFETFHRVKSWRSEVNAMCEQTRKVYSMFGRVRKLAPNEFVGTISVNHVIQSTAADFLKFAMLDMSRILKGTKSRMCANIHDEIQAYIHYDDFNLVPKLIECMEKERIDKERAPVPMVAELSASMTNWADCKELKRTEAVDIQLQRMRNNHERISNSNAIN